MPNGFRFLRFKLIITTRVRHLEINFHYCHWLIIIIICLFSFMLIRLNTICHIGRAAKKTPSVGWKKLHYLGLNYIVKMFFLGLRFVSAVKLLSIFIAVKLFLAWSSICYAVKLLSSFLTYINQYSIFKSVAMGFLVSVCFTFFGCRMVFSHTLDWMVNCGWWVIIKNV